MGSHGMVGIEMKGDDNGGERTGCRVNRDGDSNSDGNISVGMSMG